MFGSGSRVDVAIRIQEEGGSPGRRLWTCVRPAQPLPPVCTRHGRPAVAYRSGLHTFRFIIFRKDLPESSAANYPFRAIAPRGAPTRYRSRSLTIPDAELTCDWPLCDRCVRRNHNVRLVLIAALTATLVGLISTIWTMTAQHTVSTDAKSLSLIVFLLGINASAFIGADFSRLAVNATKLRMSPTFTSITVAAHPDFAEALEFSG